MEPTRILNVSSRVVQCVFRVISKGNKKARARGIPRKVSKRERQIRGIANKMEESFNGYMFLKLIGICRSG
jgi:hypothetical protein